MYVLHSAHYGGAEIQLWRRLRLLARYGVQPVVVIPSVLQDSENGRRLKDELADEGISLEAVEYTCFTEPRSPDEFLSELERGQIRTLLETVRPVLVHTVTFIPSFGQVCVELGIPHVATLYAVQDDFAWRSGHPGFRHCSLVQSDCRRYARRWGQLLEVPHFVSRDTAPEGLFRLGQTRRLESLETEPPDADTAPLRLVLTGTFQERKQQLETIQAAGQLMREGLDFQLAFYGYTHFFPDYVRRCRRAISDLGLEDRVSIHEFTDDLETVLGSADALLSLSTYESFPGSIKDALAAGIPVVATPAGGVGELILDGQTGILCAGLPVDELAEGIRRLLQLSPAERDRIGEAGRRLARLELHPYRTANDLFSMYNQAIKSTRSTAEHAAGVWPAPLALPGRVSANDLAPNQRSGKDGEGLADGEKSSRRIVHPSGAMLSLFPIGPGAIYRLQPDRPDWCGLEVVLDPHGLPVSGRLAVTVWGAGGRILRQAACDLNGFRASGWAALTFPSIHSAAGMPFELVFTFEPNGRHRVLSLYQATDPLPRPLRALNRLLRLAGLRLRGGDLYCRMWYA